jgi:hypothetical protein
MTAAAVQVLAEVKSLPGVSGALSGARSYLMSAQEAGGGFDDPFVTAWVLQAIEAFNDSPADWANEEGKTPLDSLVATQEADGGQDTDPNDYSTRAWATAYAIPAAEGLTWDSILKDFDRPEGNTDDKDDTDSENKTDETATTTDTLIAPLPPEEEPVESAAEVFVDPPMLMDAPEAASAPVSKANIAQTNSGAPAKAAAVISVAQDTPSVETDIDSSTLTASAGNSGAWEWLKMLFRDLWSFVVGLFS